MDGSDNLDLEAGTDEDKGIATNSKSNYPEESKVNSEGKKDVLAPNEIKSSTAPEASTLISTTGNVIGNGTHSSNIDEQESGSEDQSMFSADSEMAGSESEVDYNDA